MGVAHGRHGRQKVSIPECNLTGMLEERFTITLIVLLNERLTQVHSQKDPRLPFGESFTLTASLTLQLSLNTFIAHPCFILSKKQKQCVQQRAHQGKLLFTLPLPVWRLHLSLDHHCCSNIQYILMTLYIMIRCIHASWCDENDNNKPIFDSL